MRPGQGTACRRRASGRVAQKWLVETEEVGVVAGMPNAAEHRRLQHSAKPGIPLFARLATGRANFAQPIHGVVEALILLANLRQHPFVHDRAIRCENHCPLLGTSGEQRTLRLVDGAVVGPLREKAANGSPFERVGEGEDGPDVLFPLRGRERSSQEPGFAVELDGLRADEASELGGLLVCCTGPPAKYALRHRD